MTFSPTQKIVCHGFYPQFGARPEQMKNGFKMEFWSPKTVPVTLGPNGPLHKIFIKNRKIATYLFLCFQYILLVLGVELKQYITNSKANYCLKEQMKNVNFSTQGLQSVPGTLGPNGPLQ